MAKTCQYKECNNPVFSHGYCRWHQFAREDKKPQRNKPAIILPKPEFNPMNFKSQLQLFEFKWVTSPRVCIVTGIPLDVFYYSGQSLRVSIFMHVLSKKKYPQFRMWPDNIALGSPKVHHLFDNGSLSEILKFEKDIKYYGTKKPCSFRLLFKIEEDLHNTYTELTGSILKKRNIIDLYNKATTC